MNKIYEEWRRKWDMGDKQAHDGWIPKRKLNKWSSFKIFKYAREEHSIKQRSLHVLWWKGCPVFKKNWCRIISRNTPINFAVPFSLVSYNIQILIHTALQPTLKINKQIKHTFLRSYLLVWKKKNTRVQNLYSNVFLQVLRYKKGLFFVLHDAFEPRLHPVVCTSYSALLYYALLGNH